MGCVNWTTLIKLGVKIHGRMREKRTLLGIHKTYLNRKALDVLMTSCIIWPLHLQFIDPKTYFNSHWGKNVFYLIKKTFSTLYFTTHAYIAKYLTL